MKGPTVWLWEKRNRNQNKADWVEKKDSGGRGGSDLAVKAGWERLAPGRQPEQRSTGAKGTEGGTSVV